MNMGKAFSYVFEDPKWLTKIGIGAIVGIVPILNFALFGYMVATMRNVIKGSEQPLPEWSDLGALWKDGFMFFLAVLVYMLPALVLMAIGLVIGVGGMMAGGSSDNLSALGAVGGIVMMCFYCIYAVYAIVLGIAYPALVVQYAREGTIGACLRFRDVLALIRKDVGAYFTGWVVFLACDIAVGFVAAITFGLGLLVGLPYLFAVMAHIFGQFSVKVGHGAAAAS